MPSVTTGTIRTIRQLRAQGRTLDQIAERTGLHRWTVWKYSSESNHATVRKIEREAHRRNYADPERLERRRESARKSMAKRRKAERNARA